MNTQEPRLLLSAYQCGPGMGSVSQIGWHWYSRLAQRLPVTLLTHIRNRAALEAVRVQILQRADAGSRDLAKAIADMAEVLTPAQRQALAEKHRQRFE